MTDILFPAIRILMILVAGYTALCLLVYFRQASYVYYPDRMVGLTPAYFKLSYDEVQLKTVDGETVAGWFVPCNTNTRAVPTVLFCHGNAGNITHRLDAMINFRNQGWNVLLFDYRGYGDSSGTPSEEGTYRDARAAWDYLVNDKGIAPERIVLYGESLGGAVATWLATQVKPGALVLDSTFSSAADMGAVMFPFLPIRKLCRFGYDTRSRLGAVECPVVVAHSRNDEMIPFVNGQRNFAAAREPKRFVEMAGVHNSGGINDDLKNLLKVVEFVDGHVHD